MAFAVSEFKTNLKGGGARPSLFTVTLRSPPTLSNHINLPRSEFLVKGSSLPASTIGTYDIFFHGKPDAPSWRLGDILGRPEENILKIEQCRPLWRARSPR